MSSEFGERRVLKGGCVGSVGGGGAGQQEPENVQCPRCESTNTKFCYYNNYNLSQPRYFCKSCRRYWTRGGSLRNIPVGGGSRKSSKRSRGGASSSTTSSTSCATSQPPPLTNDIISNSDKTMTSSQGLPILDTPVSLQGSFSSLLGSVQQDNPFLGLGGYGLGLGFDGSAFGSGTGVAGSSDQEPPSGWHEPEGGDCFGWPELAISTPAGTPRFEHTFWPAN